MEQLHMKCSEEMGELAEVLLVESGVLPHKTVNEDAFHEAADVFICLIGVLATHYPDLSPREIYTTLEQAVGQKTEKYTNLVK